MEFENEAKYILDAKLKEDPEFQLQNLKLKLENVMQISVNEDSNYIKGINLDLPINKKLKWKNRMIKRNKLRFQSKMTDGVRDFMINNLAKLEVSPLD